MSVVVVCNDPLVLTANKFSEVCPTGWIPVTYDPTLAEQFTVADLDPVALGEWFTLGFVIFLIPFLAAKMAKLLLYSIRKF